MKTLYLYLADEYLGELAVDYVRGRETYMFRYDPAYLRTDRPMLDPAIRNVTGPQYPQTNGIFGFLADVAPDRWGRKLIRRRRAGGSRRCLTSIRTRTEANMRSPWAISLPTPVIIV